MLDVFLVKDTKRFLSELSLSQDDISLDIQLLYKEWLEILFNAFHMDKNFDDSRLQEIRTRKALLTLSEELPGFPMFLRIKAIYYDAVYNEQEIGLLKEECNRIKLLTDDSTALDGINKILKICELAESCRLNICMLGK